MIAKETTICTENKEPGCNIYRSLNCKSADVNMLT